MMAIDCIHPVRKLWALLKPLALWFVISGLAAISAGFLDQLVPLQVRSLVNLAFGGKTAAVATAGAILCVTLFATQLLRIGQRLAAEWAATRISVGLFQSGVHHLLSYPLEWFHRNHSGAVQVRLERSSRAVAELFKMVLSDLLPPLAGLGLATYLMFTADRTVGLVAGLVVPLLATLTIWQARSQAGIRVQINRAREDQGYLFSGSGACRINNLRAFDPRNPRCLWAFGLVTC